MIAQNFTLLDTSLPGVARLVAAMVQARDAIESRSWSHPQEPTTEEWWADVLADPRVRTRKRRSSEVTVECTSYRLADEPRATILVACSKCEWKAAYQRAELLATYGPACPMPSLLNHLAALGCPRLGSHWDRCGVHYVEPIEGARWLFFGAPNPRAGSGAITISWGADAGDQVYAAGGATLPSMVCLGRQ